ncbi:MAG: TolC family protein [Elusimicrobia bacterium]|nr:TolC family protein [Elusimicrobiota bacterium]MDE2425986.1 TolC family protein [Elusimicrobiota bacterium]
MAVLLAILLAASLPPALCAAPAAQRWSLTQAVEEVLSASPELAQARERREAAAAGLAQARLEALPRLTARAQVARGDDPVYVFSSLLQQRRFEARNFALDALNHPGDLTAIHGALELGLPLFTAYALTTERLKARAGLSAARAAGEASLQAERAQAVEAYLRILLASSLLANDSKRVEAAKTEIEEADRLRERGLVLGADFYAARALLAGLRASQSRRRSELASAQATLALLAGRGEEEAIETTGRLDGTDSPEVSLRSLTEEALQRRGELLRARADEISAAAGLRRARLSALPSLEAFAALSADSSDLSSSASSRLVGLRASLPLGDPSYFERRRRAAAQLGAARADSKTLERSIRIELAQRYQDYESARAQLPLARSAAQEAASSLRLLRPLYREGRESILDVLKGERALEEARAAALQAAFSAHLGYARLRAAAGTLDEAAVGEIAARLGEAR